MSYAAGKGSNGFHFLRLAQFVFQREFLAHVLGDLDLRLATRELDLLSRDLRRCQLAAFTAMPRPKECSRRSAPKHLDKFGDVFRQPQLRMPALPEFLATTS